MCKYIIHHDSIGLIFNEAHYAFHNNLLQWKYGIGLKNTVLYIVNHWFKNPYQQNIPLSKIKSRVFLIKILISDIFQIPEEYIQSHMILSSKLPHLTAV